MAALMSAFIPDHQPNVSYWHISTLFEQAFYVVY
jgi:hypothetical protein